MSKQVTKKCPRCGKLYRLGWNGVVGSCDSCAGLERDAEGNFWEPGATSQEYVKAGDSLDNHFTVQRPPTVKR